MHQVVTTYGIPYILFTNRRTVFEYKKKKSPSIEDDTFPQFIYVCKQLVIELKTISVAQAKGRIERMLKILQSRIPLEMQLACIAVLSKLTNS